MQNVTSKTIVVYAPVHKTKLEIRMLNANTSANLMPSVLKIKYVLIRNVSILVQICAERTQYVTCLIIFLHVTVLLVDLETL